jgi:23S rRNA (uridine2552-2'-O)-methyltransferase
LTGTGGDRRLKQRVRTARRRKLSSTRWLERQLNDPYVARAKAAGYRSRAAFKLAEIADAYRFLKPGDRVLDLGAAPGGWSQVAAERVDAARGAGHVVAVDLTEMDAIAGVDVLQLDFMDADAPERIRAALDGPADVVLSDMAPATTGHRSTDHLRIMALAEASFDFAREVLAPKGTFLTKVFQGGTEAALLAIMKRDFEKVRHVKPKASRAGSSELYVLATGFRGG